MHARIATARVRPGSSDQVAAGWRRLLDPYRETGAFRGLVSLHEPDDGVAVTLTLWDSPEAADAVVEPLRALAAEVFADVLLEAPVIVPYDVLITALPPAHE